MLDWTLLQYEAKIVDTGFESSSAEVTATQCGHNLLSQSQLACTVSLGQMNCRSESLCGHPVVPLARESSLFQSPPKPDHPWRPIQVQSP